MVSHGQAFQCVSTVSFRPGAQLYYLHVCLFVHTCVLSVHIYQSLWLPALTFINTWHVSKRKTCWAAPLRWGLANASFILVVVPSLIKLALTWCFLRWTAPHLAVSGDGGGVCGGSHKGVKLVWFRMASAAAPRHGPMGGLWRHPGPLEGAL